MASKSKKSSRERRGRPKVAKGRSEILGPGFWSDLPAYARHAIVLTVLVLSTAIYFAPAVFQGQKLVGSDQVQSRAMAKSMIEYAEETGEDPLWATNLFSGMPGYLIYYPKDVAQIDSPVSWMGRHMYPVAHFLLLLGGIYVLVFSVTKDNLSALIAALAGAFTTYIPIIISAGHSSKFAAISWIPWLLAAFRYVLKNPRLLSGGLFAVVLAAELRAGHPQISYNVAWLIGLWWIVEGVFSSRDGQLRNYARATGLLALGTLAAVALVAQPYLAQFEYKQFSTRGSSASGATESVGLAWDYAMRWSQGKAELLTLFVADTFGGGAGTYWGSKPFTEGPHYIGGIVLLLAVIAVVGRRGRTVLGISIGTLVLTLFSLGENAAWLNRPLFDYFPLFSAFRAPEIWLHMVELCLAILAGLGAAWIVDKGRLAGTKRIVLASAGCLLGVALLLTVAGASLLPFERPNEGAQVAQQLAARENISPTNPAVQRTVDQYLAQASAQRAEMFESDAVRTTIFLAIAMVALWIFFAGKIRGWALLAVLAALVLTDLWGVDKRHLSSSDFTAQAVDARVARYGFDQFIIDKVNEAGGPGHFRALSLESSPTNWARPAFYYETSGGYNAAKLQLYQEFIDNVLFEPSGIPTEIGLDLTATRYVVSPRPLPGMREVHADPTGFNVLERINAGPRNHFVERFRVVDAPEAVYAQLNDSGFDKDAEAVVASDPGIDAAPIDSSSTAEVVLSEYGPRRIEWEVATDRDRLFVTSEIFYPAGWQAFVDGVEVPIIRANHAFRSVVVPAGEHKVTMTFNPESHSLSVLITTIAVIVVYGGLLLLLGSAWLGRRRSNDAG